MYAGTPFSAKMLSHAADHRVGDRVEVPVDTLAVVDEDVECGVHAGQRHRVARVGAAVQHGAVRLELHELLLAAERGGARRAAADGLGHAGDVGNDSVQLLRAAQGDAEPGDDLVEDEHHVVLVADAAQTLEEPGHRRDDAGVAEDGLGEHAGELVTMPLDEHLDRVDVVERGDDHRLFHGLGMPAPEGRVRGNFSAPAAPSAGTCE